MMDIARIKKEIDEWYNSKAYDEWCERLLHMNELIQRNNKILHNMTVEQRYEVINKIYNKYNSQKYKDRELKAGYYEPRNPLYTILWDYTSEYCIKSLIDLNNWFPEEQYNIDNNFIIGMIIGQGTLIYLKKLK